MRRDPLEAKPKEKPELTIQYYFQEKADFVRIIVTREIQNPRLYVIVIIFQEVSTEKTAKKLFLNIILRLTDIV